MNTMQDIEQTRNNEKHLENENQSQDVNNNNMYTHVDINSNNIIDSRLNYNSSSLSGTLRRSVISNNFNRLKNLMTPEEINNIKLQCIELYKKGENADAAQEKLGVSKRFFYDSIRPTKELTPEEKIDRLLGQMIKKENKIMQLEQESENILKDINNIRKESNLPPVVNKKDLIITTTKLKGNGNFKTIAEPWRSQQMFNVQMPPSHHHCHHSHDRPILKNKLKMKKKQSFLGKIFNFGSKKQNKVKNVNPIPKPPRSFVSSKQNEVINQSGEMEENSKENDNKKVQ